jgi:hypothetical protein
MDAGMDIGMEAVSIAFIFVLAAVGIPLAVLSYFHKKRKDD